MNFNVFSFIERFAPDAPLIRRSAPYFFASLEVSPASGGPFG
jgi:hypothetical protein